MTISSSLNAGVAGLAANASRLATISDNIANSGTIGYKRAETSFQSMVTESGTGTYTAGGVTSSSSRLIDEGGALRATSNATDLAVRGRGFLPLTPQSAVNAGVTDLPLQLATTGSFRTDKDGYLVNSSGLILMGVRADASGTIPTFPRDTKEGLVPIQIDLNQSSADPTTQMSLGVNLPATETEFGAPAATQTLPIEYFDNLGRSQQLTITFTPTAPATAADPATNEWTMEVTDSATPGGPVGNFTIVFDATVANGGTVASVTTNATTPAGGTWDPATGLVDITTADGTPGVGTISLNLGAQFTGSGLTQYSDSFAPTNISKNGAPAGNLTTVDVDRNGFVTATFDTGITRTVYQIPLVDMPNPNGLTALDSQTFANSIESGSFFLWDAGDGATGDVISFALEESATDVAGELTALIQTQRAYSSNAKVIQTVDEMLQETTNIKR